MISETVYSNTIFQLTPCFFIDLPLCSVLCNAGSSSAYLITGSGHSSFLSCQAYVTVSPFMCLSTYFREYNVINCRAQGPNGENKSCKRNKLYLSFKHKASENSLVKHLSPSILGDAPVVNDTAQIGM